VPKSKNFAVPKKNTVPKMMAFPKRRVYSTPQRDNPTQDTAAAEPRLRFLLSLKEFKDASKQASVKIDQPKSESMPPKKPISAPGKAPGKVAAARQQLPSRDVQSFYKTPQKPDVIQSPQPQFLNRPAQAFPKTSVKPEAVKSAQPQPPSKETKKPPKVPTGVVPRRPVPNPVTASFPRYGGPGIVAVQSAPSQHSRDYSINRDRRIRKRPSAWSMPELNHDFRGNDGSAESIVVLEQWAEASSSEEEFSDDEDWEYLDNQVRNAPHDSFGPHGAPGRVKIFQAKTEIHEDHSCCILM
jgi:hypothetical protein